MTADELDEDVGEIAYSLDQYLPRLGRSTAGESPPGLDGALRSIFEDLGPARGRLDGRAAPSRPRR